MIETIGQEPKLMMSDSLQEVVSPEEVASLYDSMFISIVLVPNNHDQSLMGSLVGIEATKNTKVDLRVSLENAFNFFSNFTKDENEKILDKVILSFNGKISIMNGPFAVTNIKIIEINPEAKSCVLAVDLIKNNKTTV